MPKNAAATAARASSYPSFDLHANGWLSTCTLTTFAKTTVASSGEFLVQAAAMHTQPPNLVLQHQFAQALAEIASPPAIGCSGHCGDNMSCLANRDFERGCHGRDAGGRVADALQLLYIWLARVRVLPNTTATADPSAPSTPANLHSLSAAFTADLNVSLKSVRVLSSTGSNVTKSKWGVFELSAASRSSEEHSGVTVQTPSWIPGSTSDGAAATAAVALGEPSSVGAVSFGEPSCCCEPPECAVSSGALAAIRCGGGLLAGCLGVSCLGVIGKGIRGKGAWLRDLANAPAADALLQDLAAGRAAVGTRRDFTALRPLSPSPLPRRLHGVATAFAITATAAGAGPIATHAATAAAVASCAAMPSTLPIVRAATRSRSAAAMPNFQSDRCNASCAAMPTTLRLRLRSLSAAAMPTALRIVRAVTGLAIAAAPALAAAAAAVVLI